MSQSPLEEQLDELAGELANEVSYYEDVDDSVISSDSIIIQQPSRNILVKSKDYLLCLLRRNSETEPLLPIHRPLSRSSSPNSESNFRPETNAYLNALLEFLWTSVLTDLIREWFLRYQVILSIVFTISLFGLAGIFYFTGHLLMELVMLKVVYCRLIDILQIGSPWNSICT